MINLNQHGVAPRTLLRRRLEALTGRPILGFDDLPILDGPHRTFGAGSDVLSQRRPGFAAFVIASGVAADARLLPDGRRQLLGLRLPGDIIQGEAHETVTALTAVELVDATPVVRELGERGPLLSRIGPAWLAALREEQAMLRDQILRLGRLSAYERLAHLLLQTHERLYHVGLASGRAFQLPLRQEMTADLLGLSVVHLSRMTQQLKRDRLMQTRGVYVTLLDRERMATIANYASRFVAEVRASDSAADSLRSARSATS